MSSYLDNQNELETRRISAHQHAKWLRGLKRNYLRAEERENIIIALNRLSSIAASAQCEAEQAWLAGYHEGRQDERNGVDPDYWNAI